MDVEKFLTIEGIIYMYNPESDLYEQCQEGHESTTSQDAKRREASDACPLKKNVWDRSQTLLLLEKVYARRDDFSNPRYRKTELYKDLSLELTECGCQFSAEQVTNRMKTLMTKYKSVKDDNSKSGNNRKSFEYYEHIEKLFGDRPGLTATASCSSISLIREQDTSTPPVASCSPHSDAEVTPGSSSDPPSKKRKILPKKSSRTEMLKWLKAFTDAAAQKEEKRVQMVEKHHKENQELIKSLLELAKKNNN